MTPTTLAETIRRDVPRHYAPRGLVLYETDALAALSATTEEGK